MMGKKDSPIADFAGSISKSIISLRNEAIRDEGEKLFLGDVVLIGDIPARRCPATEPSKTGRTPTAMEKFA
jgi:hypothetical protein